MASRQPAEVFPPGVFVREELEERGWSQTDFAEILGRPASMVNELIGGKRGVSPETARDLAAAFGTSPELWMNLDAAYQLAKVSKNSENAIARRARIYEKAPVKEMVRRGWIEETDNVDVLESQLLQFFGTESLDEEPDLPRHAARKATSYLEAATPAQKVWILRAAQIARAAGASSHTKAKLAKAISNLKMCIHEPLESRHVPKILADAGIRFVVVQPLPSTKIDGACFWIDEKPVIAMSLRFDRIDNFWFVLMHELGHLSRGEESLDIDLAVGDNSEDKPAYEQVADQFANEHLLPQAKLESFIARTRPLYSARRIRAFAQTVGVHPGIVVGQLQHRKEVSYSSFRNTLVPIREVVTASAITDGWGAVLPTRF